jgi:hypothetical protein
LLHKKFPGKKSDENLRTDKNRRKIGAEKKVDKILNQEKQKKTLSREKSRQDFESKKIGNDFQPTKTPNKFNVQLQFNSSNIYQISPKTTHSNQFQHSCLVLSAHSFFSSCDKPFLGVSSQMKINS